MSRVSVIVPVYNGEKYLRQAIDSILNQTYQDFELILIDDCSTDNSVGVIRSYTDTRIYLYQNEINKGIAFTRNRGLDLAKGEFVALLDNDDIAMPYRLEHEVDYLDKNRYIDAVGGHLRRIDQDGNDINKPWNVYLNPNYIKAYLMLGDTIANGTMLFRKEVVDKNNIRFRDKMYGAEDYMFWVEFSQYGRIANMDEVMLLWRVGYGNETERTRKEALAERKRVLDGIHNYALERNGFKLSEDELDILNKIFMEEGTPDNNEELEQLYLILRKIAQQATNMNLDNANEVVTMCRKRFGEKVGKAFFLWDNL